MENENVACFFYYKKPDIALKFQLFQVSGSYYLCTSSFV